MMNNNNQTKNNKGLISYEELESVISKIGLKEFTVLDFYDYIKDFERAMWERLNSTYMDSDGKKGYSPLNYISSRLMHYSWRKDSCLQPHISYNKDKEKCFRKLADNEKGRLRSNNIAVFRLKEELMG